MNIQKLILFICFISSFHFGVAQNSNIEISFGNYQQKAIEIVLTENNKTISQLFHSYEELKSSTKFKSLGIAIANYIHLENDAIKVNIAKISDDLKEKSHNKNTTLDISHSTDKKKITIDIQIKSI
ncbi:hypothetical protein SAMN04489761_3602 [Tenacibaculum sp. MAR_2009_124]|uniref:hypothetical protein n=1 Tax=Tenacibaculum sp. MAR_2009_124 TaxID=1250059 RepID=UPI00089CB535|nr:hypothetical protein [Tenacibaculum sp. MAR_2009_124]SEC79376.1 hypothetical protein SAMN04489761_3602 [Tenacibaculum sp. MAR_2009_124]